MTDDLREPSDAELTTRLAAELLNVSEPFLVGLLEAGEIEYRSVGADHRIATASLLKYKQEDDHRRRLVADELTRLSHEER